MLNLAAATGDNKTLADAPCKKLCQAQNIDELKNVL